MPMQTRSEYAQVKRSKIHMSGMFATKDIPKGARIIEYVGDKITKKQSDAIFERDFEKSKNHTAAGGVYIFELNNRYDINGNVSWNTAKNINHSCSPNAEVEIKGGEIWVVSTKRIKKGEEITYNYGYGIDDYESHPCACGSKRCVGYILDESLWPKLKKKLAAKKKKELRKKQESKKKKVKEKN